MMTETRIHRLASFPALSARRESILIHDRKLARAVPGFRKWAAGFAHAYPVSAGESLKDISNFPTHVYRILKITEEIPASRLTLVASGGGSVGDFAGFVASVLKRGVKLVHFPSTWLAALDSAHGGKTALNAGGIKNQVGTFYPATDVYLVRSLLMAQPTDRAREAFGELSKIALIDARPWVGRMRRSRLQGAELLWKFLPDAIESKYRVVCKDPFEKLGRRRVLNLGHTLGHVLEAWHGVPHGVAVGHGLLFALEWGTRQGLMSRAQHEDLRAWLGEQFGIQNKRSWKPIPTARFMELVRQDKKRDFSGQVQFVFLRKPGRPELMQVKWSKLLTEARRQGWLR